MTEPLSNLIPKIENAFKRVRLEDGISLSETDVIDAYGTAQERAKARNTDELIDWRRIPDEELARHDCCLNFLDAKGMRFYLPAFLCFVLRRFSNSDSAVINGTIWRLENKDDVFDLFTSQQKDAIRMFLKFIAFNAEGSDVDKLSAKRSLETTWIQSE